MIKKITLMSAALMLLISSLGMNSYAAAYDTCTRRHRIGSKESLATIAMKYNTSVRTLMTLNRIPNEFFTFVGQKLCVSAYRSTSSGPIVLIKNTVRDTNVTLRIGGFPKKDKLDIFIGSQGTQGRDGIQVATATVDNNGVAELTVEIPASLRGQAKLSVRVQNAKAKLVANNGFNNITSAPGAYSDMPTANVTGWVYNTSVTIAFVNAPAGVSYKVWMVASARRTSTHIVTQTINTGSGGAFSATINLPASLKGNKQVYILFQDAQSGSFAYASYTNK